MIKGIRNSLVSSNKYIVRFAQSTEEVEAAQHLRFKVFNLELGEGLASSYDNELDVDEFDDQCHHLLVIDRNSDVVIGTYRMQTYELASKNHGFYTAMEFDLSEVPEAILNESIEVGRACIEREHRNGRVLFLLWRGLAEYMSQMKCRYLFGCCSITSQDTVEAWEVMKFLEHGNHLHPEMRAAATDDFYCREEEITSDRWKDTQLPQLFRLYLDLGAKVCSVPALDSNFKTIDYLILLDVEKLDERTRLLFFK